MTGTYHHPTYADGEPILIGHHVEITTGQMEDTVGVVTGVEEGWLLLDADGETVRTDARCVERYWPPVKLDGAVIPYDVALDLAELFANGTDRWFAGTTAVVAEIPRDVADRFVTAVDRVVAGTGGEWADLVEVQARIGSALEGDG